MADRRRKYSTDSTDDVSFSLINHNFVDFNKKKLFSERKRKKKKIKISP